MIPRTWTTLTPTNRFSLIVRYARAAIARASRILSQIVGHEDDVGRLERRLRAGDPHGYADICRR